MILVLTTCKNKKEAEKIGLALLKKRLAACSVVISGAASFYFWPPRSKKIARSNEAILLLKTLSKKFADIEREVKKIHSYQTPMIAQISVKAINKEYLKWLKAELS